MFFADTTLAQTANQNAVAEPSAWSMIMDGSIFPFILAKLANTALTVASGLVISAGYILDVSIKLTLHIKEFVDATPEIYVIWKALRDITGLFFIFFLLNAAVRMIISQGNSQSYGKLIKDIVIAGILINFSFFITSVLIDASNIVSQAIYNSMIPNHSTVSFSDNPSISKMAAGQTEKVDISNIFMNSLKLQTLYNTQNQSGWSDSLRIVLVAVAGVIMMVTTAASFTIASIAFIARLVILIFLLAFSPLWFAGMTLMPQLKSQFDVWSKLKSQLIFMPVYLLLMYVALRILNQSTFFNAPLASSTTLATGTNWAFPLIVMAINFTIVIIMLNLPLMIGLSMGGMATDFLKKSVGNWDARKVWGGFSGMVGTNTIGRMATRTDKWLGNTRIGNSYLARDFRANTVGALAKNKFGGARTLEEQNKLSKEVAVKKKEIVNQNTFNTALNRASKNKTPLENKTLKDSISKMTTKNKLALGAKTLENIEVLKHLKDEDFEAIKKSEDFTDDEKGKIFEARNEALKDAVSKKELDIVKHMVNNMSGKDLMKLTKKHAETLKSGEVVNNLKSSQLKVMDEEGLDSNTKQVIGAKIADTLGTSNQHNAAGYITKNKVNWLNPNSGPDFTI